MLKVLLLLMSNRIKIDIEMVCINKTYFQAKTDCIRFNPIVNEYPLVLPRTGAIHIKITHNAKISLINKVFMLYAAALIPSAIKPDLTSI